MSLTVQSLFDATAELYRLKILAGRSGMNHPVSWMYYTEDASTINFIRGGELVITTGMSIGRQILNTGRNDPSFTDEYFALLARRLHLLGASGLIVNTGRYINDIPSPIRALCDTLNLPLFSMPWEIHMIDIMQDYGNRIVSERQKRTNLSQCFYDALFRPDRFSSSLLENTGFAGAIAYSIIVLQLSDELFQRDDEELSRYMDYSFNGKLQLTPLSFCWFVHDHKIVYVLHENPFSAANSIHKLCLSDRYFRGMKIGVSETCSAVSSLFQEYQHAVLALDFCEENKTISYYHDLGILKLLAEVKDRRILEQFYDDVLGKLSVFSKEKREDYLKTLQLYIEKNGKVYRAAVENSTHRNTINYRIHRIRETLGVDLQNGETRYCIQTAFYIKKLLEKRLD